MELDVPEPCPKLGSYRIMYKYVLDQMNSVSGDVQLYSNGKSRQIGPCAKI